MKPLNVILFTCLLALEVGAQVNVQVEFSDPCTNTSTKAIGDFHPRKLTIYPNPASDFIILSQAIMDDLKTLYIYDVTGIIVQESNAVAIMEKNSVVSVRDLQNGIYFIQIIDQNGSSIVSKIIVNHE